MTDRNNLLEDLAKLTSNAAGVVMESGKNLQDKVKSLVSRNLSEMDVVSREEFEVVKKMAEKARLENEQLLKRVEALEGKKSSTNKVKAKTSAKTTKKPTTKRTANKK